MGMIIRREMTITHDDFSRLLPTTLADYHFKIAGHSIRVKMQSGSVEIQLMPETKRKIGALFVPVTHLTFQFINTAQDEMQLFSNKFNHAYHKGGG